MNKRILFSIIYITFFLTSCISLDKNIAAAEEAIKRAKAINAQKYDPDNLSYAETEIKSAKEKKE